MVAGIHFMRDLLALHFSKILIKVKNKVCCPFILFCRAFLIRFLRCLDRNRVLISVGVGFYGVYHRVASGKKFHEDHDHSGDDGVHEYSVQDLDNFVVSTQLNHARRGGTALGGVCTVVGEPQNLLIAEKAGWEFMEFFWRMAPVTMPVLAAAYHLCST